MPFRIDKLKKFESFNNVNLIDAKDTITVPIGKSDNIERTGDNYTKTDNYAQKLDLFAKVKDFESIAELIEFGIERCGSDFGKLSAEEQYNKLLAFWGISDDEVVAMAKELDENSQAEEYEDDEKDFFDHKSFSELSNEDKVKAYALELAKNKFLYADKNAQKTEENWSALSDKQKTELIQNEISNIVKEGSEGKFCEDSVSKTLEDKMLWLQVANKKHTSLEEFNSLDKKEQFDIISDYIYEMAESDNPEVSDNLSARQLEAIKERKNLSLAVIAECKKLGIADFGNGDITLQPSEIATYLEEIKDKTGKDVLQIQIDYLKDRQEKGIPLDEEQKNNLEFYQNLQNGLNKVKDIPVQNYGRLKAMNNSEYGKLLDGATSTSDKLTVYGEYIEQNFSSLSPEDFAQAVGELTSEIMADDNGKIEGSLLYAKILKEATPEQRQALAKLTNPYSQVNNTVHINEHDLESAIEVAKTQEENGFYELSGLRIGISDDEHAHATSAIDSASKSESVQRAHKDRVLGIENAAYQFNMGMNTANNSSLNIRKEFSLETWKLKEENQAAVQNELIKDKEVAIYANQNGDISKFAESQQDAIHSAYFDRFHQDDFSKDEAVNQLNRLADQIQNCSSKNQLSMHDRMMGSKYSEVQEHAAGNIKNYDSSVQVKAMDSVYKSGNQKAIDKAVENMTLYKSDDVKKQELGRVFGEHCAQIADEKDLKERFLGGELTLQEISQLPASQRREYYVNLFKKATPAQKLAWLNQMPDGTQKKTVYTFIALYDSNLLTSMIENGKGLEMFTVCSDLTARNKIFTIMKRKSSGNHDVRDQLAQIMKNPQKFGYHIDDNEQAPNTESLSFIS